MKKHIVHLLLLMYATIFSCSAMASGGSAGGHLAAAASNLPGLEEEEDLSVRSRPDTLILFNPVYDNGPAGYGYKRIGDRYREISPMHNISEGAPPTIVFLGTEDRLIPVSTAQACTAKMEYVESRCDMHLFEGQGHGFFNYKQTDNCRNTLKEANRFLVSLGYIESEIRFRQENSQTRLFESVFISEKMRVLRLAEMYRDELPLSVTAWTSERSAGGPNDFYSEGDYWWPDPDDPGGPYIRRDGLSNPDNFSHHRHAMIRMSRIVGTMAGAYLATGDDYYVEKAMEHLRVWFITQHTRMNPNMQYAQAIQGRHTGRGIGIIDAIHLVEPALAILAIEDSPAISEEELYTMKQWFRDFLAWISTHEYGKSEMIHPNNHGTCWALQAAAYALLVNDPAMLEFCAERYREVLLPDQLASDGSFPLELKRTKSYGYSIFNLDAMSSLVQLLSLAGIDLFSYSAAEGKSLQNGISFLYPYIIDKQKWPYPEDVLYHDHYPVKQAFLLFGGIAFSNPDYIRTWQELESDPVHPEVTRNTIVKNPLLWLVKKVPGKSRMLQNPVIPGFHPDPSIRPVGEDF